MKLPASTQKIIAEIASSIREASPNRELVNQGFAEHLLRLKLPAREIVFHGDLNEALSAIMRASGARRGAAWDAAWDAAWGAARDAAWGAARDAAWDAGAAANPFLPFLKILRGGCFFWWVAPTAVHAVLLSIFSEDGRLHRDRGPAVQYENSKGLWFWKGVRVPEEVILRPQGITAKQILAEQNAEVRRVMIERVGIERFVRESGARRVHEHEMGLLFEISLPGDPDGVLKAVQVQCPSTGRLYFLRVPPSIDRADDAVAWTFGFETAKRYQPLAET